MNENLPEDLSAIRARIEGKRVVSVEPNGERLTLDDGTVLDLYMSESDCCASASGTWVLQPDALDAIITDVKAEITGDCVPNGDGATSTAIVTILHNQNPIALADCYADDGNGGYYCSTLSLSVRVPGAVSVDARVVEA